MLDQEAECCGVGACVIVAGPEETACILTKPAPESNGDVECLT